MVISIASQKGGTGKTSTTISLAAGLAHRGNKVLLVEIDSQANSSKVLLHDYQEIAKERTIFGTILERKPLPVHATHVSNFYTMKKKLNIEAITNELSGGSAFSPVYRREGQGSPAEPPNSSPSPQREPEPATSSLSTRSVGRPSPRTPVRPNGRRIITRNSFEIYEDQMDTLRRRAMEKSSRKDWVVCQLWSGKRSTST